MLRALSGSGNCSAQVFDLHAGPGKGFQVEPLSFLLGARRAFQAKLPLRLLLWGLASERHFDHAAPLVKAYNPWFISSAD